MVKYTGVGVDVINPPCGIDYLFVCSRIESSLLRHFLPEKRKISFIAVLISKFRGHRPIFWNLF